MAGTLTLPENPKAAVVLVSGSGPQDRDQLFMGHKTFLVLADYLSRNGIAVLRYDDRGVGESEGKFEDATSYEFAEDASAAVTYLSGLKALRDARIGIIGHSEGGLVAPVVAKQNERVNFIVLLAGPSRSGKFISQNQMKTILASNGLSEDAAIAGSGITAELNRIVLENSHLSKLAARQKLIDGYQARWQQLPHEIQTQLKSLGGGTLPEPRITMLLSPWYKAFLQHEPKQYLSTLNIPILALFAEKDVQINAKAHLESMQQAIRNSSPMSKVEVLADHNHLFQTAVTGAMSEYQQIEETLSQRTLTLVEDWIMSLTH